MLPISWNVMMLRHLWADVPPSPPPQNTKQQQLRPAETTAKYWVKWLFWLFGCFLCRTVISSCLLTRSGKGPSQFVNEHRIKFHLICKCLVADPPNNLVCVYVLVKSGFKVLIWNQFELVPYWYCYIHIDCCCLIRIDEESFELAKSKPRPQLKCCSETPRSIFMLKYHVLHVSWRNIAVSFSQALVPNVNKNQGSFELLSQSSLVTLSNSRDETVVSAKATLRPKKAQVNYLYKLRVNCQMYADDTILHVSRKNPEIATGILCLIGSNTIIHFWSIKRPAH